MAVPRDFAIHLAEDSAPLRDLLTTRLEAAPGVRVTATARTATEALAHLWRDPPDLLVLDLQLEGSSAFDVLRELNPLPVRPCVAVLTNQADPETRAACLAAGADAFFDKSAELEAFLDAVQGWAHGAKLCRNPPTI